ncbi:DUF4158 domain-containing protein [Actinosynnema sp. NPDC050436]|uniref:DUF4158 domain-containing protein n=1 Tax=Actinosynnema sp. NPDC050436 TaxID=3155659 RepID=UPI0033EE393F
MGRLRSWPQELGRDELIRFFTLGSDDVAWVDATTRGAGNRLGLAVQLCALPWLGFVPDDVAAVPAAAVSRVAVRLGWRAAKAGEWKDLEEFLLARALEHDAPSVLFRLACEYLHSAQIVRPGVVPLLRAVAGARERAVAETHLRLSPLLGASRQTELDGLLAVGPQLSISRLAWLHRGCDDGVADGDPGGVGQAAVPARVGRARAGPVGAARRAAPVVGGVDTALIRSQWDEMLRLAASLKYGHATASLVVGKLHAASRRSALAQALVEFGGLQRTLYVLVTWNPRAR